ncbi:MAG: aspartate/glutamate racemase family protein [Sphaerochaetaceae bacterium]|nr:aspartate/glutamate racemase family protein [Sphaerochaetaceae bacterium]MDD3942131.1 aspartate/glutamate racemase family protein [Sphaerochaetaceae bacterium]
MIYRQKGKQVSYGEQVGILLLENYAPFIPGDTANATTYDFPVRFKLVEGLTVKRIFAHDLSLKDEMISAGRSLVEEGGVRAITGDCGFMALFQKEMAAALGVPVMLSSLLQIPFIRLLIPADKKIGIITANAKSLDKTVFDAIDVPFDDRLVIEGLEDKPAFNSGINEECGFLDTDLVEKEVVQAAMTLLERDKDIRVILSECSVLPPYGKAIQDATGLPVFDFVTMINYVHSAVVKKTFSGHM